MENYATAGDERAAKSTPELGRLKAAAERIGIATTKIDYFLDRFNGPRPEGPSNPTGESSDCYRNDLDSLFVALDRLENAVSALGHIG